MQGSIGEVVAYVTCLFVGATWLPLWGRAFAHIIAIAIHLRQPHALPYAKTQSLLPIESSSSSSASISKHHQHQQLLYFLLHLLLLFILHFSWADSCKTQPNRNVFFAPSFSSAVKTR
jgi:hypothetical protein